MSMQQQMMQFKFEEETNDEEANNTGINNDTKVIAVKRDSIVSSLSLVNDRGVDAPIRQSKGDWRKAASRRHTSSAYRRQQQQQTNNLRASLRSHGHGMSLVNVNAEQSHANDITPDYHENILQQFGLFNGLSTRVALNAQERKAEERHRKQVMGFACRVICNTQLLFAIISYIAVTAVIVHAQAIRESQVVEWLSASHSGMAFFSAFVGFILVFRTQICYNRWWEGRCLWGTLIFAAINLAQQGQGSFTDKENFRRLCCLIVCFAFACKNQLHGLSIEADGDYLLSRGLVNRNEFDQVVKRPGWQPYYFLGALREIIDVDLCKSGQSRFSNTNLYSFKGSTTDAQLLMMDGALGQMANIIGDLIRVKATGLPLGYDTIFYFIFLVYFLVTTLSWAVLLQWYTPILMGLLHLVVRCITELGTCLEDPFGDDITDLPLDKFCQAIETQIAAVFNDTFPTNKGLMCVWPSRKLCIDKAVNFDDSSSSATSTQTKRTVVISAVEPITPEEEPSAGPSLTTILSGDALSGDEV